MPRKTAPAPPTPAKVAAALRAGEFASALELARKLHALTPTTEHLALRKQVVAAAATHFADRDRPADFVRVIAESAEIAPDDAAWQTERACLLARGGNLTAALRIADPAAHPQVLGFAADHAVRTQSHAALPPELHPGLDAILTAFRHHEAGDEPAARAALEPVGLRSPFLEWKVLLRGLLAHAAGDDVRAAENFARLDPARLPARLAAPYRAATDPAFTASLPADAAAALLKQLDRLTAGPLVDGLRAIAREFGRDKPLTAAFRAAESLVPKLTPAAPDLVPRLANGFYHAVVQQGQSEDLPRFRKLFGEPADDPQFHRLLALVGEQIGDPVGAHAHWQRYEAWLAKNPLNWPAELLSRARAAVWMRMGNNAANAAEDAGDDDLFGFFAPPRRRKPRKPDPPAEACFRRAAELAPDWETTAGSLFGVLMDSKKPAEAEAAARAFLARRPDHLPTLVSLAELLQRQGRSADACGLWLRASELNPLDRPTRFRAAAAVLAAARRELIAGKPAAADALFEQHRGMLEEQAPAGLFALRSVTATKLGDADAAADYRTKALAAPGGRLGAAYRMMVDSQLAKLKPAQKKPAEALFAEELAKPPTPLEVNQLVAAYDGYHLDGITYRGQKTHEKKVLDQATRCLAVDAPETDFERLGEVLVVKQEWKPAKKFADAMLDRFPVNPYFLLARSEVGHATRERPYFTEQRLARAKKLAEASAEPRHRQLLERIDRLRKQLSTPFDIFDSLFGDRE